MRGSAVELRLPRDGRNEYDVVAGVERSASMRLISFWGNFRILNHLVLFTKEN